MITGRRTTDSDARTRKAPNVTLLVILLGPAMAVVLLLFGGGLVLGTLQGFGGSLAAEQSRYSLLHFQRVLADPDFLWSLALTLYISLTSTIIAAAVSVAAAVALVTLQKTRRVVDFLFQLPLTVPHLVIATAVVFLLAPTGLISRVAQAIGMIDDPAGFPLMINDTWGIGIIVTYVWKEIPFITLMVLAVLENVATELLEVGKTLNASRWQRLRHIILPTIFPSLGAACLIVFAYTFGAFEVPYLLGRTYPMTLPVWAYRNYSDVDLLARPEGIATGILIAVVVCVCIVCSQAFIQMARRKGVIL